MLIDWRTKSVFGAAFAPVIWTFDSAGAGASSGTTVNLDRRRRAEAAMFVLKALGMPL